MKNVVLKATRRDAQSGKTVKALRREGYVPAVMYGHNFKPVSILLDAHTANLALAGLSASAIITVELDGTESATLIRERQKDYLKNRLLHVDFQVVSLNETIRAAVNIELTGTSPAVKEHNAVIVTNVSTVNVEALPRDMPQTIQVDISSLEAVGEAIYVRDLVIPSGVTVLTDPEEIVVVATGAAPEEVEEVVAETDAAEPEVIERGKKEDEEDEA
jgi:large subunit ribosomal protein L25